MNKILGILFLILISFQLAGQQTNPFDITKRKTAPKTIKTSDSLSSLSPEIKEVVNDTSMISPVPVKIAVDKKEVISDSNILKDSLKETNNSGSSVLEIQLQKLIDENPFNVSRIPLKQKKIKKEAEVKEEEVIPLKTTEIKEDTTRNNQIDSSTVTQQKKQPVSLQKSIQKDTNKFIFWIFFLQMLLVTSLMGINRSFIPKIWRSISNDNFAKLINRDYNSGYTVHFVILYLLFLFSLSLYIFLVLETFYAISGIINFLIILGSVSAVYGIRHLFQNITANIFPFGKASSYYDFMIIIFNSFLGLVLIPMNVLSAYAPYGLSKLGLYLGLTIIVITYALRFLRGTLNAYTFIRNYLFHFFLYLCTCEIAPVFILVKLLSKSFIN